MFNIIITEKGGQPRIMDFDKPEVTIGRVAGNDIVLPKGNISKRHSRVVQKEGKFIIVDLKSTNGTYVNGKKITGPQVIKDSDKVYIGDFTLTLEQPAGSNPDLEAPAVGLAKASSAPPKILNGAKDSPAPEEPDPFASLGSDEDEPAPALGREPQDGPAQAGVNLPEADPEHLAQESFEEEFDAAVNPEPEAPPPPAPPVAPRPAPPKPVAVRAPAPPDPALAKPPPPPPKMVPRPPTRAAVDLAAASPAAVNAPRPKHAAAAGAHLLQAAAAARDVHGALAMWLEEQGVDLALLTDVDLQAKVKEGVDDCLSRLDLVLPAGVSPAEIGDLVAGEVTGGGALDPILMDDSVDEVFINGPTYVAVTRGGVQQLTQRFFSGEQALHNAVLRLLARGGARADDNPMVDARLKDGSRLCAVMDPVAAHGPVVRWRRGHPAGVTVEDLQKAGVLSPPMTEFLKTCVGARRNVVVAGSSGSGKTELLGALGALIPDSDRVVLVEEASELSLPQPQVVALETRPPRPDGAGGVDAASLVRTALRMTPDRVILGECRGGEALPLLLAMSAGQDGTMLSEHAHSPRDCLTRLEMMVHMSGQDLPAKAVRELLANAVDVVVEITRFGDGSRRVTQICELRGMEVDFITMQPVFTYKREAGEENRQGKGSFQATGVVPRFYEDLQQRGLSPNLGIFREDG